MNALIENILKKWMVEKIFGKCFEEFCSTRNTCENCPYGTFCDSNECFDAYKTHILNEINNDIDEVEE